MVAVLALTKPAVGSFLLLKIGRKPRPTYQPVVGGEIIEGEFRVVATPGHTEGHVSFFHLPSRNLFAGDALAIKGGAICFMSRPVTPNLATSWESMRVLMQINFRYVCPGHRHPLTANVEAERARVAEYLDKQTRWPMFG